MKELPLRDVEGAAEFVTELTTGSVAYAYLAPLVDGREKEIETSFAADIDKTDLSGWLYNSTPEKPADLGYWVGYRIVKSYYQRAGDKRLALRRMRARYRSRRDAITPAPSRRT